MLRPMKGGAQLLLGHGEEVEGVVLRAFVPVSLHAGQPDQARGNLDGAMFVPPDR
jgi:diacylglycerol O-acyltransferase / wax synthase